MGKNDRLITRKCPTLGNDGIKTVNTSYLLLAESSGSDRKDAIDLACKSGFSYWNDKTRQLLQYPSSVVLELGGESICSMEKK